MAFVDVGGKVFGRDWFRAWGVIILAVYVSVSAFGFVDPISFLSAVFLGHSSTSGFV